MSFPADLDRVLEEDDWLRRMARQLVGDPHKAEDLVQEAWVVALQSGRADRGWLFGVLRNLRREAARRVHRDEGLRAAIPPRAEAPPVDEVVAELRLRKSVTEGLLELDEPYRTALYLRYVQDLKLPEIARRTGVAVSTVHQRIARGLELMRARLDEHFGGERRVWAIGLLSLAKPSGFVAGLLGGAVVGIGVKIAVSLVVVGGTMAWVWSGAGDDSFASKAPASTHTVTETHAAQPERLTTTPLTETAERATVAAHQPESPPTALPETPIPVRIIGRVLDLDGATVAGIRVGLEGDRVSKQREWLATTNAAGVFKFPVGDPAREEPRLVSLEPGHVTLLHGVPSGGELIVLVGRAAGFAGVVVDHEGTPIASAELTLDLRQSLFRDLSIPRPFINSKQLQTLQTDEHGRFELEDACGGSYVGLWVAAQGFEDRVVDLPGTGDSTLRIVLELSGDERVLEGFVLDLLGAPISGASVSAGRDIVTSDEDGAFRLPWKLEETGNYMLGEDGAWRPEYDTSVIRAIQTGFLPAQVPIEGLDLSETIELRLGAAALAIRGRVIDERGVARGGVLVWAGDLTPFGSRHQKSGGARAEWKVTIEQLGAATTGDFGVQADDAGRFALPGLLERDYDLYAFDPASGIRGGPWRAAAGAREVELLLATEPDTNRVAGRVVTLSGVPIEDAWIVPRRSHKSGRTGQPPHLPGVELGVHTDEEGRFAFAALATRGTVLELQHESFFIRHFELEGLSALDDLEIVEPVLCELQVELAWDPELADTVRVLDAEGEALEMLVSFGAFLTAGDFAKFSEGRTGVIQTLETASTIVLLKDGAEVLREKVILDPTGRTLVRL